MIAFPHYRALLSCSLCFSLRFNYAKRQAQNPWDPEVICLCACSVYEIRNINLKENVYNVQRQLSEGTSLLRRHTGNGQTS
jgi:hypothetical protein